MQFSDVIGQGTVKQHLADMLANNRLSHALLFVGKEGSGALPLAIAFSQYILCEKVSNRQAPGPSLFGEDLTPPALPSEACGLCSACLKAAAFAHPDIHFSYPVVPKKPGDKPVSTDYIAEWREFIGQYPYGNAFDWLQFIGAENRQGNITAHECADIIHKLSLKSFESGYKVLLMWMPEYLGTEGNKLLKLIEEPPPDTLFILVAENENVILPTIISRTQLVKVPPLSDTDIKTALMSRANLNDVQASQIASVSSGNFRESLQLLQHADEDWQALLREWLNAIVKNSTTAQVRWIEEMSKQGREKQKQFLRYFNHMLEVAIRIRILEASAGAYAANEADFAGRLNNLAGIEQQQAMITELDRAAYYVERNAHSKMLFHALTIKLYHIITNKSVILTV